MGNLFSTKNTENTETEQNIIFKETNTITPSSSIDVATNTNNTLEETLSKSPKRTNSAPQLENISLTNA